MLDVWSRVTICFPEKQQLMAVDMLKVRTEGQHFSHSCKLACLRHDKVDICIQ